MRLKFMDCDSELQNIYKKSIHFFWLGTLNIQKYFWKPNLCQVMLDAEDLKMS